MPKFRFCINKDAQLYTELKKVEFGGLSFTVEEICPFLPVFARFSRRSCQLSETGPIKLLKNVNKPELIYMTNKLEQSEIENSHNTG